MELVHITIDNINVSQENGSMYLPVYLATFLSGIFFCGLAHAGSMKIGVEPYLGYGEFSYSAGEASDSKTGPILGGKGGLYFNQSWWGALDYHLGGPYNLANNDNEFLNRMWGIGVGYVQKGKVRAWGGYYYSSEIDDVENNYAYIGTGIKLSLGFEVRPKLSLNVEYSKQDYKKVRGGGDTVATPSTWEVSVLYLSLSSPISLY